MSMRVAGLGRDSFEQQLNSMEGWGGGKGNAKVFLFFFIIILWRPSTSTELPTEWSNTTRTDFRSTLSHPLFLPFFLCWWWKRIASFHKSGKWAIAKLDGQVWIISMEKGKIFIVDDLRSLFQTKTHSNEENAWMRRRKSEKSETKELETFFFQTDLRFSFCEFTEISLRSLVPFFGEGRVRGRTTSPPWPARAGFFYGEMWYFGVSENSTKDFHRRWRVRKTRVVNHPLSPPPPILFFYCSRK